MKKNIMILFAILVYSINNYAQSPESIHGFDTKNATIIDTAKLMVSYKLSFLTDSTRKNVVQTNNLTLFVGSKYSKFINSQYIGLDEWQKTAPKGSAYNLDGRGLAATIIYKNRKVNKMIVNIMLNDNKVYRYEELLPKQIWRFTNKKKEIHGYLCQSATTNYLGRDYTAWFAPSIPIQEGPWKFSGLPGLILEVSDSRRHYVFNFVGIEKMKQIQPIDEYKMKFVETNRKKLNNYIKNLHKNYAAILEAQGFDVLYMTPDGKVLDNKKLSYPYNPIELE